MGYLGAKMGCRKVGAGPQGCSEASPTMQDQSPELCGTSSKSGRLHSDSNC